MDVTVGIAFQDNRATLALAIRSVFAQTLPSWTLILVDDASTDGSREIAESVRDPRVTVVSDGMWRGLPGRLNQICALSQTEFVARMDADDVMHPLRLEKQVHLLRSRPDVDLVATSAYALDRQNIVYGLHSHSPLPLAPSGYLWNSAIAHPSVMARRRWMLNHPYDESFIRSQDKELWCRVQPGARFEKILEPLIFHRESGHFKLSQYRMTQQMDRRLMRRHGPRLAGSGLSTLRIASSLAKEGLYLFAVAVRQEDRVLRRRPAAIDERSKEAAQRTLRAVSGTVVEGLG